MAKNSPRSPFEQMKLSNRDPRDNMFNNPLAQLEVKASPVNAVENLQKPSMPWSGALGDTPGQQ